MKKRSSAASAASAATADECRDVVRPGLAARLRTREVPAVKQRLRDRYPQPTQRQLQRARQPLYDCMHDELLEDGHPETAAYLLGLIDAESDRQAAVSEDMRLRELWQVPAQLERLLEAFKRAERMPTESRTVATRAELVAELLEIGLQFAGNLDDGSGAARLPRKEPDYRWVAESVLLRALLEARKIVNDQFETAARVQYHVGMYYVASEFLYN